MKAKITEHQITDGNIVGMDVNDIISLLRGRQEVKVFSQDGSLRTSALVKKLKGCRSLLLGIEAGKDINIKDVRSIVEAFAKKVSPKTLLLWSASTVKGSRGKLLVVAGW